MPEILLENVSKHFGDFCAVDHIDVVIPDGAFFTLLGPSGCGKTTTLRMIAGLEKPTAGKITVGGKVFFDSSTWTIVPPGKRNIGMVFQSYALWPHMTVHQNISFPLQIKKLPSDQIAEKVEAAMQQVQISGLSNRYPSELSGGQQQRVAVARELVTGADVLLMDEPLGNLDAKLRLEMRSELKKLHDSTGQTIVYVTHDQLEALTISTHVALMKDGIIQQISDPDAIYAKPNNTFVAEFIGNLPINLLDVTAIDGFLEDKETGFRIPLLEHNQRLLGQITLGIRPENLHLKNEPSENTIQCLVDSVLPAGSEVLVRIALGNRYLNMVTARGAVLKPGQEVDVYFDLDEASFFDQASGKNLSAK